MLNKETQEKLIKTGREFMKGDQKNDPYTDLFESDQDQKLPQPPLVKAPIRPESEWIRLSMDFEKLNLQNDLVKLFRNRRSARVYTQENITIEQLSFLLWSTQGIKSIRGKSYATLRTVPCGGARHEYETYMIIQKVAGLAEGVYHYLPMEHALEYIKPLSDTKQAISESLCEQTWAEKSNVVFYWTMDAYRAEWRYGIYAHRPALIDAGHIGQNLYLACTALEIGCCGIAAFSHEKCCELFDLDGENEYPVYTATVGTVREKDLAEENMFYKFVEENGL